MDDYSDIIDRPRHVSRRHAPMPASNRAAQFLPFAALAGYEGEIAEAARLTERQIELTEAEKAELGGKLAALAERLPARARLTWFVHDARKDGGQYVTRAVTIRRIQPERGAITLEGEGEVDMDQLLDIEEDAGETV